MDIVHAARGPVAAALLVVELSALSVSVTGCGRQDGDTTAPSSKAQPLHQAVELRAKVSNLVKSNPTSSSDVVLLSEADLKVLAGQLSEVSRSRGGDKLELPPRAHAALLQALPIVFESSIPNGQKMAFAELVGKVRPATLNELLSQIASVPASTLLSQPERYVEAVLWDSLRMVREEYTKNPNIELKAAVEKAWLGLVDETIARGEVNGFANSVAETAWNFDGNSFPIFTPTAPSRQGPITEKLLTWKDGKAAINWGNSFK
jgi:hypothetical protein